MRPAPSPDRTAPRQALCLARAEIEQRGQSAHPRVQAFYGLMVTFADHELARARPADLGDVLESLRAIYRAAELIERRITRGRAVRR